MGEIAYSPLDYKLELPSIRILRRLCFFDWIDARELYDASGVPENMNNEQRNTDRNGASVALARLLRNAQVERRGKRGPYGEYRITAVGRRYLREQLLVDMSIEYAPARPGTEHLLCEWTEDECSSIA